jgi:hypothetical protein
MTLYYLNEAVLDLPDLGFVDSTIHGLEAKTPSDATLGVLVHRRPVDAGATLRELVDENVALNGRRLRAFIVESDRPTLVGGLPGFVLATRWRHEKRENVQLQAHVLVAQAWMIFAVSAPLDERAACEETFRTLLETLTLRSDVV